MKLKKQKTNWKYPQMGEVCNFIGGSQPPKSEFIFEPKEGYVRLLQIRDYKSDKNMTYIQKEKARRFCSKDDIMIGRYGPPLFQILRGLEGAYNVALMKASPKNANILDREYLYYFLKNERLFNYVVSNSERTAGQDGIKKELLEAYQIPLPPLEEQKRIAAILDRADAIRRKRKEAIRLTEELLRSTFLDMFGDPVTNPKGWEVKPLGEIATFLGGGTPSRKQSQYYEGDICWASSKDMSVDVLVDTEEHITKKAINNSSTKLVDVGVLLIVVKSKILMRRLPVARTEVPTCFNQDIKAIVPHDLSITRYLHRHLKLGQETLLRQARGVNTEGLTLDHLRNYKVMTPPVTQINKFVELEKTLERSLSTNQKVDKESHNLFNSLLQKAFRGEL